MLSKTSNFRYYIPLCPRPKVLVTADMLDKLKYKDSDSLTINAHKYFIHCALYEENFKIAKYSPHLYNGFIIRNLAYMGVVFCLLLKGYDIVYCVGLLLLIWYGSWSFYDDILHKIRLHDTYQGITDTRYLKTE